MAYRYIYERRQRRTAVTLIINVAVLLLMVLAAFRYLPDDEAGRQLLGWIKLAASATVVILLCLAAIFWFSNGRFRISVDDTTLEVQEPLFKSHSFRVLIDEIVEVKHVFDPQTKTSSIILRMESEPNRRLTPNYHYSRKELYAALSSVNPKIVMPEHHWRFKRA